MSTTSLPAGYHSVNAYITVKGAAEALEFYKKAFNAEERYRLASPDGKIMHAEIAIGDSVVMLSDEAPDWGALSPKTIGGCPFTLIVYVPDVDAAHAQAVQAGATPTMPVSDQFWGDRMGGVLDPYGFKWSLATHIEDVSPKEIQKRFEAFASKEGGCTDSPDKSA
ncbi:MAG: VOC family protein [Verrucomicrobiaceae bacterium]|nr:MAG: VOC family protein [Verrucomicrobiaceae bacterium]